VTDFEFEELQRNYPEFKIQTGIIDHIRGRKTEARAFNVFVCHVFQGRNGKEGFFLKLLGVFAGVGDLLILWRSKCSCGIPKVGIGFLEVKSSTGTQEAPQKKFEGICHWLGVHYAIVRSVDEAHYTLIAWGCTPNHNAIREADTRTVAEKYQAAYDFYKRKEPCE
jgi:hypothetical protein